MKNLSKIVYSLVSAALLLGVVTLNSCKEDEKLPPIGGFDNADQVGETSLVAYWNFDDNLKETKSGATPAYQNNNSFTTGIKGKALDLNDGMLHYNTIAALNSLPSFTVSAWVKISNNGTKPTMIFSLTRPDEWAGAINMMAETGWKAAGNDTLNLKCLIVPKIGTESTFQDNRNEPSKGGDQAFKSPNTWFQLTNVWDAATSNLYVYANGKKISNPEWEHRLFNGNPIGALTFFNPTQVVIGAFSFNVPSWGKTPDAWMTPMKGQIDEIRVWSKALAPEDISSLYQLELAGR